MDKIDKIDKIGVSVQSWIEADFKGFSFKRSNPKAKRKFFVMLDPYSHMTDDKLVKDLQKGDLFEDSEGVIIKVVDFGGSGMFGKGSFSWMWVGFYLVNRSLNHG